MKNENTVIFFFFFLPSTWSSWHGRTRTPSRQNLCLRNWPNCFALPQAAISYVNMSAYVKQTAVKIKLLSFSVFKSRVPSLLARTLKIWHNFSRHIWGYFSTTKERPAIILPGNKADILRNILSYSPFVFSASVALKCLKKMLMLYLDVRHIDFSQNALWLTSPLVARWRSRCALTAEGGTARLKIFPPKPSAPVHMSVPRCVVAGGKFTS